MADDDSFQVWGTFSVRDHLQPWAFVAEVLIYDRLVVPVPPEGDDDEEQRWVTERWDPARQRALLEILGDLAVQVEWDADRRRQWGAEFAVARERLGNQVAFETGLAYELTGARLIDDVPRLARPVVATTPFTPAGAGRSVVDPTRATEARITRSESWPRTPPGGS